jgi:hypothetical protein
VRRLCADLLESTRPAEEASVPLRQALQPMRAGFTAVQDAVGIIDGWISLG